MTDSTIAQKKAESSADDISVSTATSDAALTAPEPARWRSSSLGFGVRHSNSPAPIRAAGRKILVAIDGSECGQEAMTWYIRNMWRQSDYCYLTHVYTTPHLPSINFSLTKFKFNIPYEVWQKKLQDALDAAQKTVKQYESICLSHGVHYKSLVVSGSPGECICHAAHDHHVDAIVMGSRGLNAVRRTLLGSVSTYTLHHSSVPVTIVPHKSSHASHHGK